MIDPCGGSFTNALGCRNFGRTFIGCDSNNQCVLQGQKRLAETPVGFSSTLVEQHASAVDAAVAASGAMSLLIPENQSLRVFQVTHGARKHVVVAETPQAAALHVAEQYLLNQTGRYNNIIQVKVGRDSLLFWIETLFKQLGYGQAS